jgi:predicted phage terminase large subunit-like protein
MKRKLAPTDYNTLTRLDYGTFIQRSFAELNPQTVLGWNWHLDLIASKLEGCRRGGIKRLIILVPPRHLKSHCASIALPAWWLGHNPSAQIICVSYAQDLADKHARDCRTVMASSWYRNSFSTRLSRDRQAVHEFTTTKQGWRYATSVGGVLTGRGADVIIIDDALKPDEAVSDVLRSRVNDWYDGTLYSRLNDKKNGVIIVIMQRLHEDDLVGHVLAQEPWEVVSLPAIAEMDEVHRIETMLGVYTHTRKVGEVLHPEREPRELLDRIRSSMGEYNFAGQYQQTPAPLGGGMIKAEWFQTYEQLPEKFDSIVQSWDTANVPGQLNSFSVCTTWGVKGTRLYLLHVLRERLDYPNLKRAVRQQGQAYGAKVILIEDKASGIQLIQELAAEGVPGITKYTPEYDKVMRMHAQSAAIESGLVYLPRQAPWLPVYLHELVSFPKGAHDDQVDSTSQALDWIRNLKRAEIDAWLKYYHRLAEEAQGRPLPWPGEPDPSTIKIRMRAPNPQAAYYMSGTDGRAGRYTADADGIIEDVHPEDVERLQKSGCVKI